MKTSEVLLEAKNLLIEDGWMKGLDHEPKYGEVHHQHCARGAIACVTQRTYAVTLSGTPIGDTVMQAAQDASEVYVMATTFLQDVIKARLGKISITSWNDNPETTEQDVLDLFDKAIAQAKDEGQ